MICKETFNQHKLNYLLENKDQYACRIYEQDYDPFLAPMKMLQKSSNGQLRVSYHQPGGRDFGRFFANGGIGLQSICREIRHTITKEFYTDLDMVNAHPVILQFICQKHDIPCNQLDGYITDREKHIEDVINQNSDLDRDAVKRVFLSLINGGNSEYNSVNNPTRFLKRFRNETINILDEVCELFPEEYVRRKKSNPNNPKGSTVNAIMCNYENDILQIIVSFYKEKKMITDNYVLCFDGVMIPKNSSIVELIPECEELIHKKTGIRVQLKVKEMKDDFKLPDNIPKYTEYKPFDPKDDFCWMEFDEKYRDIIFKTQEDVLNQTRRDLNRVLCKVEQGAGFIVKKTDCGDNLIDILDRNSNFTDMFFRYYDAKGEKVSEMNFKRYLQLFSNSINRYRTIDFAPRCKDPKVFNLWTGFVAEKCDIEMDLIQPILWHIKHIICNGDLISYDYFLDLLYYLLKYPEKPLGVATFIYSRRHGSGKNILLDFLQDYVFGKNITYYTTGLDTVLEKHNHLLKNKKIVVVDEMASSSDKWVGNFDKLKSMMTGPFININPKGVNQYSIKNVLAWFLISNHEDSVRLEASDRRYFCLSVSEEKIGDRKYFKQLAESFTQKTGNTFYSYIIQRGDARDVNIRTPPITAFKREIIGRGWSSSIKFLFDIKDNKYDDDETEIKGLKLYEKYEQWCLQRREKVKTKTKFCSEIKGYITKKRLRTGMVYDMKSITFGN